MTFIIFIAECLAGFAIGMFIVIIIAFFIAYTKTDKTVSEVTLAEPLREKALSYMEKAKDAEAKGYEEAFRDVYDVLMPIDVKENKLLCWHGEYEYIKPVILYSFSKTEALRTLVYSAVSELLSEGYSEGPDILLEIDMTKDSREKGVKGFGNCMAHEITEGAETVFAAMAALTTDLKKRILLSNTWFSKYCFRVIGAAKTQKFFSDTIDDIYERSPEAAFACGVKMYMEIIKMQKNY